MELQHVSKSLDVQQLLSDINLSFAEGEVHGLVGENGAGKSVMVNVLSGVYPPDSGKVLFQGKECVFSNPQEALKYGIVTIYQECNLIPDLTVAENLCINQWYYKGSLFRRIDWETMMQRAQERLKEFNCEIPAYTKVRDLSHAQKRLVEIVKAFNQNAKILIMDEPYESLTPAEAELLSPAITRLCQRGGAVLCISQRLEELMLICDQVTVLKEGKIMAGAPAHDEKERLELFHQIAEWESKRKFPRIYSGIGRVVLEARELSTDRGLKNVSLNLHKGEILGVAGRVGSGRTALARALFGLDALNGGSISINGSQMSFTSPADAVRAHVGYISDGGHTESLFHNFRIGGNITISNLRGITKGPHLSLSKEKQAETYCRVVVKQ